jgi:Flp pilus assembly protein TadG
MTLSVARRRTRRGLLRDDQGTAAVELAVGGMVFVMLLFGALEFGRLFWTLASLQFAVEQAARCAAINATSCTTSSATQTYAAGRVFGQTVASSVFTVSHPTCGTQVSASLPFSFIVPHLFPYTITLSTQSCRPV